MLAQARSFLFVPADRPERYVKALASGADAVVIDLEDAVAPAAKDAARATLRSAWPTLAMRERVVIRVNAASDAAHQADLALVAALRLEGLGGAMVPKLESGAAIERVAAVCPGLALLPLIESAAAFLQLDAIARAPQVVRLCFGHLDLQADLGMQAGPDEAELAPARWQLVAASRRAGIAAPVDGVTAALGDGAKLREDTRRALRFGFGAKLCIHPAQVAEVHAAMRPAPERLEWARRVLEAAAAAGGAAVQVDGRMVDAPVIRMAQQISRAGD